MKHQLLPRRTLCQSPPWRGCALVLTHSLCILLLWKDLQTGFYPKELVPFQMYLLNPFCVATARRVGP